MASEIKNSWSKSIAYARISKALSEQGKLKNPKLASEITHAGSKSKVYGEISKVLMERGKMKQSQEAIKESLKWASEITDEYKKSNLRRVINGVEQERRNP